MPTTLLYVEPDAADAAIHASVLRDNWPRRFEIVRAETTAQARERLSEGGIDCVLLACPDPAAELPWLSSVAPAVPVVVLTDEDDAVLGLRTVELGAQDHLVRGADGNALGRAILYAVERKRTERRLLADHDRREAELRRLADHDGLTGLPVRRRLIELLDLALARDERHATGGAVVLLRLEDLQVDDAELGAAAERLSARVRRGDVLARVGTKSFAVLLAAGGPAAARRAAAALLTALSEPEGAGPLRASAGIAVLAESVERSAELVLARAGAASAPAGRPAAPAPPVGLTLARTSWAERLRTALHRDAFALVAQPIASVATEEIPRYELLLRLHEDGRVFLPEEFLPAAEREGLSAEIDNWVLVRAATIAAERAAAGVPICLEVNLSPPSVADPGLADRIGMLLDETGADPAHLVLELPERSVTADTRRARLLAEELQALGCVVALDAVGRGGSSLAYLDHLGFDLLKIDTTLAGDVAQGCARRALVEAVIAIARSSGARTVAEGVADAGAAEILRTLGVDYAQGYHFGAPAPLNDAPAAA